ncbi:MAG: phage holin, LLH family [Christensenella sp.]
MKKVLCVMVALMFIIALPVAVVAESAAAVTDGAGGSLTELITQIVVWLIGGLFGLAAWTIKKYIVPWMQNIVVPWLKTKNLSSVAAEIVRYAEAQLGRYTGDEKWQLAVDTLKNMGWDINDTEVVAALKAAWATLNIEQIAAGIKPAYESQPPISGGDGE